MDLGATINTIGSGISSAASNVMNWAKAPITNTEHGIADWLGGKGDVKNEALFGDFWNGVYDAFTLGGASRMQNYLSAKNREAEASANKQVISDYMKDQQKLTDYQFEKQKEYDQNYYSNIKESLLKAGYNPWLALQSGISDPGKVSSGSSAKAYEVPSYNVKRADGTKAAIQALAACAGIIKSAAEVASSAAA